ncbi:MAG: aldehyde dehydrogenase family protein, partial [Betaproteobacteria bacterium]
MLRGQLFIDGAWRAAHAGALMDVIDPASEQVFAQVASAQARDVDAAVRAARRAFDTGPWPRLSGCER